MTLRNDSPKNLAEEVVSELERRSLALPSLELLTDLFESMYFASLRTEEGEPIVFHIVYLDPKKPDPDPPQVIVKDRWSYVPLSKRILVTIPNLVKIAKASDPRSSSLAIYHGSRERLEIWGLIDQGNSYYDYINYNSDEGPERPGLFQASIVGPGHIVVFIEYEKIAELRIDTILPSASDVLWGGPVLETLLTGVQVYIDTVKRNVPEAVYKNRDHWDSSLMFNWVSALCRLLLRIQNFHHGGAILITPATNLSGLNVKYKINYSRLRSALETQALAQIQHTFASDIIGEEYLDPLADEIPVDLYLDESVSERDLYENRSELDGTTWFIALLSRVDGLVLMNPSLEVLGFGVEITFSDEPSGLFIARSRNATDSQLRKADYNYYGTRHRSMMRYCSKIPGSVGFVISQDGDVRVITQVRDKLVVWENIKLQSYESLRRKKPGRRTEP